MRWLALDRPPVWMASLAAVAALRWRSEAVAADLGRPAVLTGWSLFALIVLLAAFNLRKRLAMLPVGDARGWLSLHVVGGTIACGAYALHVGTFWPTGAYERVLAVLFYLVTLTGVVGFVVQRVYPPYLTRTGVEVIYERVPRELAHLRKQAQELVVECTAKTGSDTLARHYQENFEWFFRRPRFSLNHAFAGNKGKSWVRKQRDTVSRYLDEAEHAYLDRLFRIGSYKNDVDFHYTAQRIMKAWLLVHLPLAAVTVVVAVWHIVLVHVYAL